MSIFISIAAYRDPLLWQTVREALATAAAPEALRFGIIEQSEHPTPADALPARGQVQLVQMDPRHSRGPCWARALALSLYAGEDHVLQIDAHTVFDPGWDRTLIDALESLASARHPKPIITTYPCPFEMGDRGPERKPAAGHALVLGPRPDAEMTAESPAFGFVATPVPTRTPVPGFHLGGGFVFARGTLFLEVPYDPVVYFLGEEQSLAVRAWTHGWDIFHIPDAPIYHLYHSATRRPLHWDVEDDQTRQLRWWDLENRSKARLRALLYDRQTLGAYGLGRQRSLAEFADFSGIDYAARRIRRQSS